MKIKLNNNNRKNIIQNYHPKNIIQKPKVIIRAGYFGFTKTSNTGKIYSKLILSRWNLF